MIGEGETASNRPKEVATRLAPAYHDGRMARRSTSTSREPNLPNTPFWRYWKSTHSPLHSLVFILPFLLIYEFGVYAMGTDLLARNQLQAFLADLGATASHLSAALVVVVLLTWQAATRTPWRIRWSTLAGMVVESFALAMPVLALGMLSRNMLMAGLTTPGHGDALARVMAGIGAGIYEEFLFRFIGLNVIGLILLDIMELPRDIGQVTAVAICAAIFALYHPLQGGLQWTPLLFFFLAGCYLGGVYLLRGFGVAVGVHMAHNLLATLLQAQHLRHG